MNIMDQITLKMFYVYAPIIMFYLIMEQLH